MPDVWEFLSATPEERQRFPDLPATLAQAEGLAAPANRLRRVHAIPAIAPEAPRYFLKEFQRSQWKNQWRALHRPPHCRLDGDRERRVAQALDAAGFGTARAVAWGRRGPGSYYLCAGLRGRDLQSLWLDCAASPALMRRGAAYAGGLLAAGFCLPDLAWEHLFYDPLQAEFAVIDLHNGALGRRPRPRMLRRILRRCRKGLAERPLPRPLALVCALRLLQRAGLSRTRRHALLRSLPPYDTHSRYDAGGKSIAYRERNPARSAREHDLLRAIWPGQPGDLVLDCPTGTGRLAPFLKKLGARRLGADRSAAMLAQARSHGPDLFQVDATRLPFANASVQGVVLFRFLHHLPKELAAEAVGEAARVARGFVVLSFFHPISVHGLKRRVRRWLSRRAATRHALWPAQLRAWMRAAGFELCAIRAEGAYRKDLWLAAFRRADAGSRQGRLSRPS